MLCLVRLCRTAEVAIWQFACQQVAADKMMNFVTQAGVRRQQPLLRLLLPLLFLHRFKSWFAVLLKAAPCHADDRLPCALRSLRPDRPGGCQRPVEVRLLSIASLLRCLALPCICVCACVCMLCTVTQKCAPDLAGASHVCSAYCGSWLVGPLCKTVIPAAAWILSGFQQSPV